MAETVGAKDVTFALKKAATWGTVVTPNAAGQRLPLLSESISQSANRIENNTLNKSILQLKDEDGSYTYSGALSSYLDAENLDIPLGLFFGTTGGAPSTPGGTLPRNQTFSVNTNPQGIFGTFAVEKSIGVYEYDSIKFVGFHLTGNAGGWWSASFDVICRRLLVESSTNHASTTTTLASATFANTDLENTMLKWNVAADSLFRFHTGDSGALDSNDDVYPSSFEFHMTRSDITTQFTSENIPYIDEPVTNGFMNCAGVLQFPRETAITNAERFLDNALGKMSVAIKAAANSIEASYEYQFNLFVPQLQVVSIDNQVGGPGLVSQTIGFKATDVTSGSNPTGMDDTTPYVTVQNKRTADVLA